MTGALVEVEDLAIEFVAEDHRFEAVRKVSFDIPRGKTVGLVGESGSGKSVTALALMRLVPTPAGKITGGRIHFDGQDLLRISDAQMRKVPGNRISMIFQEPMTSLNPVFTVGDQIAEAIMLHQGASKETAMRRAVALLRDVGIPDPEERIKSYPHEMSGGQRQRVMIAIAIACKPDLLIADEPTTALDVTIQKQILDLLAHLQRKYGMSMLFITHDLAVVGEIADAIAVMYKGEIVEAGSCADIFRAPSHPYTKALLSCRPSLEGNPRRLPTVSDFMDDAGYEKRLDLDRKRQEKTPRPITDTNPVLLEIKDIKKHFPKAKTWLGTPTAWVKAVDGVSLRVRKGRTLGLVGESGCGKTTLGRIILRLIDASEGEVNYAGRNLRSLSPRDMREIRKKIQIIFQDPYASLNPRMSVGGNIMEPLAIHGIGGTKRERLRMAGDMMERCGLPSAMLSRYPHELSGGQRQRVCISRALIVEPELVVCDECVSALDVSIQAQILNLLLDLQDTFNLTYVFISHDLAVVKFMADEVCVMNFGKVIEMADAVQIYKAPQNDYTKRLLQAIPKGIHACAEEGLP